VQRICRAISDETGRNRTLLDSKTVVERLNRMMIGWANYSCLGPDNKASGAGSPRLPEDSSVALQQA
jgi:hypothetical protein